MAFPSSRRSIPRPPRLAIVLAVGQRVYIHSTEVPAAPVALGDEGGTLLSGASLPDGVEVEILAWRPRGAGDTRYRVLGPGNADGWLPAGNLRKSPGALPPPASEVEAR